MASLRRVHLGGQDAEMIRSMVRNKTRGATLPAEKGVRRVGITTFIGATLRDNVPYSPRRRAGSRAECRSGEALKRGRRCHRMVEDFVETGKVPLPPAPSRSKQVDLPKTWARSIIRVLQQANIEPLRAEVSAESLPPRPNAAEAVCADYSCRCLAAWAAFARRSTC